MTIFETFIADVLLLVFQKEPRCLSSGRTLFWEKVIELGDYDSVIDYFATQRVTDVLSGDWYKIVEEFNKLFNIDLSTEIEGRSIAEIFQIRHAIVHNAGLVDQTFIRKVQASDWGLRYDLSREIIVKQRALRRMTSYIEYVVDYIYEKILDKFGTG